jgi:hypothetical protein
MAVESAVFATAEGEVIGEAGLMGDPFGSQAAWAAIQVLAGQIGKHGAGGRALGQVAVEHGDVGEETQVGELGI